MARTDAAAVQGIIETDATIDLAPFIDTANLLVTDVCGGFEYSDAKLEMIERWLAAHFYAIRDMRASREQAGSVSQAFQYKVDLGLNVTMYGQQVLRLDTEGGFAALEARSKGLGKLDGSVTWLGTVNWGET